MWIRIIDNHNPKAPKVFEYAEGVLSGCDYRIHNNGKVTISLSKDGYSPNENLEMAMISLKSKDSFDVELYSGNSVVKSVKCRINTYNMGSGEMGEIRERAELSVLIEGIDYTLAFPVILDTIYDVQDKTLTVFTENLVKDDNGIYLFDITKMSIFGVSLSATSMINSVHSGAFTIRLSDEDHLVVERARSSGAKAEMRVVSGWNSNRSDGGEIILRVTNTNVVQEAEIGSIEGLSS